jgi:hypothetical protein
MESIAWLALAGMLAVIAFGGWLLHKRWGERTQAAAAREASFMAGFAPRPIATAIPKDASSLPQQKLLFEAAAKAAEAGEPALSIQLYARLLARYPESGFAAQARAAVEVQKKKFAKR